jgi:mono/diheme cytochrome c family protein
MHNSPFRKHARYFLSLFFVFALLFLLGSPVLLAQDEGKELFKQCAACHSLGSDKLIGPGLAGVTERHDREWLIRFIINSQEVIQSGDEYAVNLFNEYNKIVMPPNNFTPEQVNSILDYIESYEEGVEMAESTPEPVEEHAEEHGKDEYVFMKETKNPYSNLQMSFIISVILIFIALFDLLVTKIIKARFIHLIIVLISAAVVIEVTVIEAQNLGRQLYYEPDQPILFSHKIHAGDNQTDCRYCHTTVDESKHAGFPSVEVCMNCHNVIKEGTYSGKDEIAKVRAAYENNEHVRWIRVHNLPDHSYFNHAQHVKVGNIDCEQCHGDVASMDRIQQVNDLSMGWCINCHRKTEVQFLTNDFYKEYEKLHAKLKSGEKVRITVDNIGGNECQKCHY